MRTMHSIQCAVCLLLFALTALQLNAEVRFTGANARQDERRFRRALALISRADPGNRVLAIEEMEEIVHLKFVPGYDYFGSLEIFPDGNPPEIILKSPERRHNRREVATTLAHEGRHFLNNTIFPFGISEDMFPPGISLILQAINEGSAFYNGIKVAERSLRYIFMRAPDKKPFLSYVSPELAHYVGLHYITQRGIQLKKWMRNQNEYRTLSDTNFEEEFKKEFFKLYLECVAYPTQALDIPQYNENPLLIGGQVPDIVEIPSWANPEFAYLREKDTRNLLITRALEVCFGDIGITPEEIDEIFNETLARIDAYRKSQNLPTIAQIEYIYYEYALNANNPQWLEERGLSQVIIASPYLDNSQELIEAVLNGMPLSRASGFAANALFGR